MFVPSTSEVRACYLRVESVEVLWVYLPVSSGEFACQNFHVEFSTPDTSELGFRRLEVQTPEINGHCIEYLAAEMEGPFGRFSATSLQHQLERTKSGAVLRFRFSPAVLASLVVLER